VALQSLSGKGDRGLAFGTPAMTGSGVSRPADMQASVGKYWTGSTNIALLAEIPG
jgi:hypothetical protein